ncbi:MAG TPA: hypothetical protein VGM76_07000 [Lacipirellulaceae bacterium]|jgi:hypothetical protein
MSPLNSLMARANGAFLVLFTAAQLPAAVVWNESASGDLSNDRLNPTSINLSAGVNSIVGQMGHFDGTNLDIDYVTVNIPANERLSGVILSNYVSDDDVSFIGMENGTQITVPTTAFTADGLQGFSHIGSSLLGSDLFPNMSQAFSGSSGFSVPLPSGPYSFWLQQRDGFDTDYQFDFVVTPPPTGDYNGNHTVDAADYTVWRDTLSQTIPAGSGADGNDSGAVDAADYSVWMSQFGKAFPGTGSGAAQSSAVPEPTALSLALIGSAVIGSLCAVRSCGRCDTFCPRE